MLTTPRGAHGGRHRSGPTVFEGVDADEDFPLTRFFRSLLGDHVCAILSVMDYESESFLSEAEEDLLIYTGEPGNWRRYYFAHPQEHAQDPYHPVPGLRSRSGGFRVDRVLREPKEM